MINVGIVGMGVIGRQVADAITTGIPGVALAGVTVRDPARAHGHRALGLEGLVRASDLIVEAATQDALREIAPSVLTAGKKPPGPCLGRPAGGVAHVGGAAGE